MEIKTYGKRIKILGRKKWFRMADVDKALTEAFKVEVY